MAEGAPFEQGKREGAQLANDAFVQMLQHSDGAAGRSAHDAAAHAGMLAHALALRRRGSDSPLPNPHPRSLCSATAIDVALRTLDALAPDGNGTALAKNLRDAPNSAPISIDSAASAIADALDRAGVSNARVGVKLLLSPEVSGNDDLHACYAAAERMRASITSDVQEATHVLTSPVPTRIDGRIAGPLRVVLWHDEYALVHTPGEPPSCDWWCKAAELPQGAIDASNMPRPGTGGAPSSQPSTSSHTGEPKERSCRPWAVVGRWLADSVAHGEWMDELEYLDPYRVSEPQHVHFHGRNEQMHRSAHMNGALPGAPPENVPARGRKRDADGYVVEKDMHGLPPEVIHIAAADGPFAGDNCGAAGRVVENLSQGQQSLSSLCNSSNRLSSAPHHANATNKQPVVPAYSAWFDWESISDVEKRSVPEFFDGRSPSKTPEVYMRARNHMVNRWREQAPHGVTFSELRKELAGDAAALMRLFNFLEQWGLVNFKAQAAKKQHADADNTRPSQQREDEAKLVTSAPPPPRWSDTLFNFSGTRAPQSSKHAASDLAARSSVQLQPPAEVYCNVTGEELTNQPRYHCIHSAHPDVDISASAYANGQFPHGLSSADFVRIDPCISNSYDNSDWTDDEILLLLEGVELYGDSWEDVAAHVASRNAHQCLLRFVQLPIEDRALGRIAASSNKPEPLSNSEPIPFEDASNPVMANIALLTTMVGPKVASAAAQAALRALEELAADDEEAEKHGQNESEATADGTTRNDEGDIDRTDGAQGSLDVHDKAPSAKAMAKSASQALGAAAVKAKLLANQEEREVHKETNALLEQQAKKVEAKLGLLEQLSTALNNERDEIATEKQQVLNERMQLQHQRNELAARLQELQPQQSQQQKTEPSVTPNE